LDQFEVPPKATSKPLRWRPFRGRRIRESRVVERSLDGLVLMSRPRDAPAPGTRFAPGDLEVGDRFGFRSALVKRVEAPNPAARLIFSEIEA
jgi:hypothetical protein